MVQCSQNYRPLRAEDTYELTIRDPSTKKGGIKGQNQHHFVRGPKVNTHRARSSLDWRPAVEWKIPYTGARESLVPLMPITIDLLFFAFKNSA